jgi:sulfide:quinone oxidoreductase
MVNPIVPDFKRFPQTGHDMFASNMEMGLAGAWMKRMLHTTFIYKLKGNPGWRVLPE